MAIVVFLGHFAKAVVGQNGKKMAHFLAQLRCQKDRKNILYDNLRFLCRQKMHDGLVLSINGVKTERTNNEEIGRFSKTGVKWPVLDILQKPK